MAQQLRTPVIMPRSQGGTFYTFSSAIEDIGLNINETGNRISLSHYAVLDLPAFNTDGAGGCFNVRATGSNYGDTADNEGNYLFADGFQNYVLNLETVLRNRDTYNFSKSATVSERAFWKWLQPYMELQDLENHSGYFTDNSGIVKAFGLMASGSQRSDSYGMYNETFVQIPSSYGRMMPYFKTVTDANCYNGTFECHTADAEGKPVIEYYSNLDSSTTRYGISYYASTDSGNSYTVSNPIQLVLDINSLREIYGDDTLTYDDLAIKSYGLTSADELDYMFNAVLLYYSIYDSTGTNILATNAYGLLIFNNAEEDGDGFKFPELQKTKSTNTSIGTSYSFRVNIKPTNVYSGDFTLTDDSVPGYSMSSDFNDIVRSLSECVDTLSSNNNILQTISTNYVAAKELITSMMNKLTEIDKTLDNILQGAAREITAQSAHIDSLTVGTVDSSVIFYDSSTGNTVGHMDSSGMTIRNMTVTDSLSINKMTVNSLNTEKIVSERGMFQLNDCKVSNGSIYVPGGYYSDSKCSMTSKINADALAELFKMTVVWKDKIADEDLGVVPPSATDIDTEYSALYNAIFGDSNDINMKNLLLAFIAFYFRNR